MLNNMFGNLGLGLGLGLGLELGSVLGLVLWLNILGTLPRYYCAFCLAKRIVLF